MPRTIGVFRGFPYLVGSLLIRFQQAAQPLPGGSRAGRSPGGDSCAPFGTIPSPIVGQYS